MKKMIHIFENKSSSFSGIPYCCNVVCWLSLREIQITADMYRNDAALYTDIFAYGRIAAVYADRYGWTDRLCGTMLINCSITGIHIPII